MRLAFTLYSVYSPHLWKAFNLEDFGQSFNNLWIMKKMQTINFVTLPDADTSFQNDARRINAIVSTPESYEYFSKYANPPPGAHSAWGTADGQLYHNTGLVSQGNPTNFFAAPTELKQIVATNSSAFNTLFADEPRSLQIVVERVAEVASRARQTAPFLSFRNQGDGSIRGGFWGGLLYVMNRREVAFYNTFARYALATTSLMVGGGVALIAITYVPSHHTRLPITRVMFDV
jgi:hypothetical protein